MIFDFSGTEIIETESKTYAQGEMCKGFKPYGLLTDSCFIPEYREISDDVGFVGRWYKKTVKSKDCMVTNNCGSSFYFKVSNATSVNVKFVKMVDNRAYFAYQIDGGELTRQLCTNGSITIPDLETHTVRCFTDGVSESISKWTTGNGFALESVTTDGEITGIVPVSPIIAFYGDSVTEGIRTLGIETEDAGDVNSATNAYPFFCCEKLNAVDYRVGYGSSGMTKVGSFGTCLTACKFFMNGLKSEQFYPAMIVINHGINDGSSSESDFKTAYNEVIKHMKSVYPDVPIVCMGGVKLGATNSWVSDIVNENDGCYYVSTGGWTHTTSDGTHPDSAGSKIIGEKLAEKIMEIIYCQYQTNT